ncbi:MAG: FAD-dependent oxidoreductase [Deltaproteobacteria bacterium]|nr:FAD-dependent oxidoreductase [Deltaproteobacteria bacterium]
MSKLSSPGDLSALRRTLVAARDPNKPGLVVCAGTACQASGSSQIVLAAKKHLLERNLLKRVSLRVTGCHGFCEMGPFVLTQPQNAFYAQVKAGDVPRLIDALLAGTYVEELLYRDPSTGVRYRNRDEIPFFKQQQRAVLGSNEKIDPTRIWDCIANDGYLGLERALGHVDRSWVVEEVKRSGLRGRGGAGFPTGRKWELLAERKDRAAKVLVCNADEGDPGAYMDRSILEGNPHSIIEGMLIGAYGTGATQGFVYVRDEYPIAIRHLEIALDQAREVGLLGQDILGAGFSFDIKVAKGAGAFVCGEETALIRSIEGKVGEPRQRPPFPVERGVWGQPTAINNVETWANVPIIFRLGAEAYAKVGTKNNAGTKVFSLVGKIKNTGLVEIPLGVSIGDVVMKIGGGSPSGAKIKAVQTGGPSGGCIPASRFDLSIDYESLGAAGSIMGSGGMIVMDENTCMVDVAKYFMNFLRSESCGKCLTCRKGTQRMHEILEDIASGKGTLAHIDLLEELAQVVKDTTMCGLGQTAANPVLSTLRYYRHEYERHVVDKRCDAFVCEELVGAPCQSACPVGTEAWRYVALLEQGKLEEAYKVIRASNPFPSICARVCDRKCEQRCRLGASGEKPVAVRALKRFVVDRVDPSCYRPPVRLRVADQKVASVAVVGAGPAGLTAANELALFGHRVTVFEADDHPGGMLLSAIPPYRLPRDVLQKEIDAILKNVEVKCGARLGRDLTIDELLAEGYQAVFLAMGAHRSARLGLSGEDVAGVISSLDFLRAFNLDRRVLARGRVGIVGGGNSAVDAARVALRCDGVESVTLLYRRTRQEMPAYAEEIEAAIEEGVQLQTLVSPVALASREAKLTGVRCIKNTLGDFDGSGRRKPVPIAGSEFDLDLDTLIVATGETPDIDYLPDMAVPVDKAGRLVADVATGATRRPGVFCGGDVLSGPNTVIDAIAAGQRAARAIHRYVQGQDTREVAEPRRPSVYVPAPGGNGADGAMPRLHHRLQPLDVRKSSFVEAELGPTEEEARREARRCLRCDLKFTQPAQAAKEEQR